MLLNRQKGPIVSLNVPSIDLTFDGCVVKNNRTLFIALALQHIRVSPITFNHNGRQHIFDSELSSQSFTRIISKILHASRIKHVWRK